MISSTLPKRYCVWTCTPAIADVFVFVAISIFPPPFRPAPLCFAKAIIKSICELLARRFNFIVYNQKRFPWRFFCCFCFVFSFLITCGWGNRSIDRSADTLYKYIIWKVNKIKIRKSLNELVTPNHIRQINCLENCIHNSKWFGPINDRRSGWAKWAISCASHSRPPN